MTDTDVQPSAAQQWVDCDIASQVVKHLDSSNAELFPLAGVSRSFREAVAGVSLSLNGSDGRVGPATLESFLHARSSQELSRITRFRLQAVGAKFLDGLAEQVRNCKFQSLRRVEARGPHSVIFYSKLIGLPCEAMPQRQWLPDISDEYLLTQMVIATEDGTPNAKDFTDLCTTIRAYREGRERQGGLRYWIGRNDASEQTASAASWLNKYFDAELDPETGREMIHVAAAYGRKQVIAELRLWVYEDSPWDFACFIFKPDHIGKSAACYAVRRQDLAMLKFLLSSSKSGEVLDDDPDIAVHPLLLCALAGRTDLCLRRDASTVVPEYVGTKKASDVWTAMGELLIEHSCRIDAGSQEQVRPLEACIRTGDEELFQALVEAAREEAVAEDRRYSLKTTAIDMARLYGRASMLRTLVWLEETSRCAPLKHEK